MILEPDQRGCTHYVGKHIQKRNAFHHQQLGLNNDCKVCLTLPESMISIKFRSA